MPIEFRCSSCGAWLRVPQEHVGKQVRCPQCQAVMTTQAAAPPHVFADRPEDLTPRYETNPYASPQSTAYSPAMAYGPVSREAIAAKVQGPAIGLMIYAVLALLLVGANLVVAVVGGPEKLAFGPPPENEAERIGQTVGVFLGVGCASGILLAVLYGAWKLLRLESYSWAMAASILALLPCSLCCVVGMPFGIWGIVVLNDPEVKQYFSLASRF